MSKKEEPQRNQLKKEPNGKRAESGVEKSIQTVLNGSFLVNRKAVRFLPFIFFLAFLGILYISNIYYAEKKVREINSLRRELKELRYEYISEKSKLMHKSKQSEVAKSLEGTGIKELTVPPDKIVITKENNDEDDQE